MNSVDIDDLDKRLKALTKLVKEISEIVEDFAMDDPLTPETVIKGGPATLEELKMLAAYVVRNVNGGKNTLLTALQLCGAKTVTSLHNDIPEQCPKFVALLQKAAGKSLAEVTSKIKF